MYNWSTNTRELKKSPKKLAIWKLENLVNFGLGGDKINKKELAKNFNKLQLDSKKRKYLKFLLS